MQKGRFSIPWLLASGIFASVGCGGSSSVPAEGKVTLDGKPLVDARVAFSPTKATNPGPFIDITDVDGKFALGEVGSDGDGVLAGEYMLIITTVKQDPNATEETPPPTQKEIVPMSYRDGSTRVTVPEGGKTDFSFDMKSR